VQTRLNVLRTIHAHDYPDVAARLLADLRREPQSLTLLSGRDQAALHWLAKYSASSATQPSGENVLPNPAGGGEVPYPAVAVLDYRQADLGGVSTNLGDYIQTLALLGNIARFTKLRLHGDEALVSFTSNLQSRVPGQLRVASSGRPVTLLAVNRDASHESNPPAGTWMFAHGWYMSPNFAGVYSFPFHKNIRPIFISFHLHAADMLTSRAKGYLRRHAPIGCRDWSTVYLLRNLDIPAFFSGCLTSTLDNIFVTDRKPMGGRVAYIDADRPNDRCAIRLSHEIGTLPCNDLTTNLLLAQDRMESYCTDYERLVTSRLHCYLPARALGCDVSFKPAKGQDSRFEGLRHLGRPQIGAMGTALRGKLSVLLSLIVSGQHESVYKKWRELCEDNVEQAARRFQSRSFVIPFATELPPLSRELARKCRSFAPSTARLEPAVALATFADRAAMVPLATMLCSALFNTSSPIRAFVLCRGIADNEYHSFATAFPEIEFCFCPLDGVRRFPGPEWGNVQPGPDMLLLPLVFPGLERVIFLDAGAVILGDIAELHRTNLAGFRFAAKATASGRKTALELVDIDAVRLPPVLASDFRRRLYGGPPLDRTNVDTDVMVLDLAKLRDEAFSEFAWTYLKRFGIGHAQAFNYCAKHPFQLLPSEWNVRPEFEVVERPRLLRWPGRLKPWNARFGAGSELWWNYRGEAESRLMVEPRRRRSSGWHR
jgi:hypothetical protein